MGRSRKQNVKRYPSGQINHKDRGNGQNGEPPDDVATWPRIKAEAKKAAQNPILATELGRLAYFAKITTTEFDAGKEWSRVVSLHRKLGIAAPHNFPKIASLEPSAKPRAIDLDALTPEARKKLIAETRAIEEQFNNAYQSLSFLGNYVLYSVNRLCLDDEPLTYGNLMYARQGLRALARKFGFAKRA